MRYNVIDRYGRLMIMWCDYDMAYSALQYYYDTYYRKTWPNGRGCYWMSYTLVKEWLRYPNESFG